jgi:hypothetical protein
MKTRFFISLLTLLTIAVVSCTDRNHDGEPEYREEKGENNYPPVDGDSASQGSKNYPGNSEGTNTADKRYGADPEINKADTIKDSTINKY